MTNRQALTGTNPITSMFLTSLGKPYNRLPEAMWLTFSPPGVAAEDWTLEKVDETVMPLDVVRGGGRAMHAVQERVALHRQCGPLAHCAVARCARGRRRQAHASEFHAGSAGLQSMASTSACSTTPGACCGALSRLTPPVSLGKVRGFRLFGGLACLNACNTRLPLALSEGFRE